MGSCASRQAIHSDEQAFGSLGTWEAARRDSENGIDAIHSRSEVEHLPQPLKTKSAWPSADQQQRTSESSPGTTTIVLVASSSVSHGRVGCINCGKHRLYIAEVKLHSMGARHPKQLARLMQVLVEWDPAFAAQLESFAALLPPKVIPEGSTAAGIDSVATGAPGPVVTRRQGSGLLRRPSLGTAVAEQASRLLLVQLPPDAAAALPALASPLHALSLSMTSWQPPEPGAAPVPAILVQHTSVSALGMAAHRSGSTVQDSADSVQQEASSKAHKAQPPGALAVGLSARLLRLVSTLDALPSLVTLCTVEGQVRASAPHCLGTSCWTAAQGGVGWCRRLQPSPAVAHLPSPGLPADPVPERQQPAVHWQPRRPGRSSQCASLQPRQSEDQQQLPG
ncbi:hypothetical protein V8C86DRAFT_1073588 [Haematococcus lacustris]